MTAHGGNERGASRKERSGRRRPLAYAVVLIASIVSVAGSGTFAGAAGLSETVTQTIVTVTTGPPQGNQCAAGYFSPTGEQPCTPAPPGKFVDTNGATEATDCPVGTFQPSAAQTGCLSAPRDFYVDVEGAIDATACPPGQATLVEGSASIDDCFVPELTLDGCTHFAVGSAPVFGTNGNDVICGDDDNNIVYALGGNDIVLGFGGNDLIFMGNDGELDATLSIGFLGEEWTWAAGQDLAFGGAGNDRIYGGNGDDSLMGGAGDDQLWGQNGEDGLRGGTFEPLFELRVPVYPLPEVVPGNDRAIGGNDSDLCQAEVMLTCER